MVDLTNDTDSETDDEVETQTIFKVTPELREKAKAISVEDRGASTSSGTQVSTSRADALKLWEEVINTFNDGNVNAIDLGSGNGMLVAVAALIKQHFNWSEFYVWGIEQCCHAVEASKKILKKLGLSATIRHENLYDVDALPTGLTHVICQSHGMNPALQFIIWQLLLQQRDTIKVVAIGIGLANKEAAMYDFFYDNKQLRSNVVTFTPTSSKTQTIHIIDTSKKAFWDDLECFMERARADEMMTLAKKAYLKLWDIKKKRLRSHSNDGGLQKRRRIQASPVNVNKFGGKGGTFTQDN